LLCERHAQWYAGLQAVWQGTLCLCLLSCCNDSDQCISHSGCGALVRHISAGAAQRDGWAWVSGTGRSPAADAGQEGEEEAAAQPEGTASLEAYGLADFVLNTIRCVMRGCKGVAGMERVQWAHHQVGLLSCSPACLPWLSTR
jgi:hypothetical protein